MRKVEMNFPSKNKPFERVGECGERDRGVGGARVLRKAPNDA